MTYVFVRLHRNFNLAASGQFLSLLGSLGFCCVPVAALPRCPVDPGLAPVHTIDRVEKESRPLRPGGCASPPAPAPPTSKGVALAGLRKWRRAGRFHNSLRSRNERGPHGVAPPPWWLKVHPPACRPRIRCFNLSPLSPLVLRDSVCACRCLCLAAQSTRGAKALLGLAPVHTIDRVKKELRPRSPGGCAPPPAPAPPAF